MGGDSNHRERQERQYHEDHLRIAGARFLRLGFSIGIGAMWIYLNIVDALSPSFEVSGHVHALFAIVLLSLFPDGAMLLIRAIRGRNGMNNNGGQK